jgi:anti-sigma B factor antagonist
MYLQIQEKKPSPGVTVLEMKGRVCMGRDCQEIEWKLTDLLEKGEKKVVFDLTGVNMMDSTGVGIMVTSFGRLKKSGGELRLVVVPGKVQEVLSMTMVDKVLSVFPTTSAATDNF